MMILPSEPVLLLSYINTMLRDNFDSLDELCKAGNVSKEEIITRLEAIEYYYDEKLNKFM